MGIQERLLLFRYAWSPMNNERSARRKHKHPMVKEALAAMVNVNRKQMIAETTWRNRTDSTRENTTGKNRTIQMTETNYNIPNALIRSWTALFGWAAPSCVEISLETYSERKNSSWWSRNIITFPSNLIMDRDFQLRGSLSRCCLKSFCKRSFFTDKYRAGDRTKLWLPECIQSWAATLVWAARVLFWNLFNTLSNKLASQKETSSDQEKL